MKRDECDGTLHEIPMREAPRRSKCYVLIPTVTLCSSPPHPSTPSRRTDHGQIVNTPVAAAPGRGLILGRN